jgi:hypothetical protein
MAKNSSKSNNARLNQTLSVPASSLGDNSVHGSVADSKQGASNIFDNLAKAPNELPVSVVNIKVIKRRQELRDLKKQHSANWSSSEEEMLDGECFLEDTFQSNVFRSTKDCIESFSSHDNTRTIQNGRCEDASLRQHQRETRKTAMTMFLK